MFNQIEASDPSESMSIVASSETQYYPMNCFPTPSYFVANMRNNNYDNTGTIFQALIPQSRQQTVFQVQGNPTHQGDTLGYLESVISNLDVDDFGSIFDPATFYTPSSTTIDAASSPLASIYNNLQTANNVFFL